MEGSRLGQSISFDKVDSLLKLGEGGDCECPELALDSGVSGCYEVGAWQMCIPTVIHERINE